VRGTLTGRYACLAPCVQPCRRTAIFFAMLKSVHYAKVTFTKSPTLSPRPPTIYVKLLLQPKRYPQLKSFDSLSGFFAHEYFKSRALRAKKHGGFCIPIRSKTTLVLGDTPKPPKAFRLRYGHNALRLPSLGCCEIFFGSDLKNFYATKNESKF